MILALKTIIYNVQMSKNYPTVTQKRQKERKEDDPCAQNNYL